MAQTTTQYARLSKALENARWRRENLGGLLDENYVFKNISGEILIDARKNSIKKYRAKTLFDYKINYSLKGCENKFAKLQNDSVYLTVTNLPELRYLDLPVYGFDLNEHYKSVSQVTEIICEQQISKHPLIDYKSSYNYIQLETLFENLLTVYREDVLETLSKEYENNELLSLLMCWNAERFEKFLDHYICGPRFMNSYELFFILVTLLERNSTDSGLIAESLRKMCTSCKHRNFSSHLPANCINFMMKHLKLSAKGPEHFGQHHEWLSAENLVAKKIYRGDKSSLKLLLRYNCPTIFHPSYDNKFFGANYLPGIQYWPRQSAGCTSFNSLKYNVYLTCLIMVLLLWTENTEEDDVTDCIRLLWDSLPTPIIPIDDMQEFLLIMSECFQWKETFTYLRFFPREFDTAYEPRSLQHLSRCAFVRNCRNPEGVSSLHLPETLKRYLMLDT